MTKRSPWTEDSDAELKRLVELGYSMNRLSVFMKRPVVFLSKRARELDISVKKLPRLPPGERQFSQATSTGSVEKR
jgi:hypothetical protein